MRLLNSTDLCFEEFPIATDHPAYAILSHTWGEEEITFEDVKRGKNYFENKKGYTKLEGCCRQAREDGYKWVWIDTCCIDKSNSVELAEAINSMYLWYKKSCVCYAYLSDVQIIDSFSSSRWFTRGWTLQETIAPDCLEFYSKDWHALGTKRSLHLSISAITGIPEAVLSGVSHDSFPVAQKMSWAANRTTSKPEDMAYCLMGIFHVNMPMLYGEGGSEAFHRLQRGIMEIIEDHTLFTWQRRDDQPDNLGFLANSPSAFSPSSKYDPTQLEPVHVTRSNGGSEPPSSTGRGLRIQLPLLPGLDKPASEEVESIHRAVLNVKHALTGERACIRLAKDRGIPNYRRMGDGFDFLHVKHFASVPLSTIYVNHTSADLRVHDLPSIDMASQLVIMVNSDSVHLIDRLIYYNGRLVVEGYGVEVPRPQLLDKRKWSLSISVAPVIKQPSPTMGTLIVLLFSVTDSKGRTLGCFAIFVGFDKAGLPWCCACTDPSVDSSPTGLGLAKHDKLSAESLSNTSLTTKGCVDRLETGLSTDHDLLAVVRRRLPLPEDPTITKSQATVDSGRQFYTYTLNLTVQESSEWAPDSPQATARASTSSSPGSPMIQRSMTNDLVGVGSFW
ncbi:hypothetical protein EG328_002306 [Venturia inaequalis]|uniref:Heterokaryon incompatibility domain-containing protein n=1 Tax=Venturia inaequalis TaxID=5025 RepID=A0A8H3UUQ7_VENIN|nr:hypothetical protein EG328_002306 [Venturia inaequalis]